MHELLDNLLASCSFINIGFLLPHTAHFDDSIVLLFLVFITFGSTFFDIFALQAVRQHVL